MKLRLLFLILLSFSIITHGLMAKNKNDNNDNSVKENINEYTYDELEKSFIPTGKQYPALSKDDPVYFEALLFTSLAPTQPQPSKYKTEQIGLLTIKIKIDTGKKVFDPNSTDYYLYLKEFAKLKGANLIKVFSCRGFTKGFNIYIYDIIFEFARIIEDK